MPAKPTQPRVGLILISLMLPLAVLAPTAAPADEAQAAARLQRLGDLVSNDRQLDARSWLLEVSSDPALAVNAREYLLYEGLLALGSLLAPDEQTTNAVKELLGYQSASTTILTEGNHRLTVALHDVASAARLTLGNWRIRAARGEILSKIARGQAPLPAWSADPDENRHIAAGLEQALAELSPAELQAWRMQISSAFVEEPRLAGSVLLIATRLDDVYLYRQLAVTGPAAVVIDMLRGLEQSLNSAQSLSIFDLVRQRDKLASAAILSIGRLQASYPAAKEQLFALLDDPQHGASAAGALARYGGLSDIQRLGGVVLDDDAGAQSRRAVLALRLHASPAARAELGRLAANPRLSVNLRQEIAQWLAQ